METATSSTISKYVKEFESLFVPIEVDLLRDKARDGKLRHCQFRSLCWRYFLRCLPEQYDQWLDECKRSRQQYEEIKVKHLASKSPESPQPSISPDNLNEKGCVDNDEATVKAEELEEERQFIKASNKCEHKNVFRTIERDVVRTFPDMEFFRQTEMQAILESVLFNYASENPHLSYKQGMHELLATLLYVLHTDSQNCLINYEGGYANETIATLLNLKYLEHDVFLLFCALMNSIESWYQNDEILIVPETISRRGTGENINRSSGRQQVSSVLSIKLKTISEKIVRNHDLELFNHLEALQIAPQIYGIRWMRLLFGREFEFLDLLTVWDAIICDQVSMSLTDYIFASMLITLREELVNGDYTDCLNNLMRHQFKDVQYVIKLALHLRDPKRNARPKLPSSGALKHISHTSNPSRFSHGTSLTSKLSQQYISDKSLNNSKYIFTAQSQNPSAKTDLNKRYSNRPTSATKTDNRDSRRIFSMTPDLQSRGRHHIDQTGGTTLSGIKFLNPSSRSTSSSLVSSNKFLPNINRIVSSIGQNIQDKTNQSRSSNVDKAQNRQRSSPVSSQGPTSGSISQHFQHNPVDNMMLPIKTVREYEMREMQSTSSSTSIPRSQANRFPLGSFGASGSKNALNLSTESYDDLHSIVDYCWRLLSEQIDSLQRCLPKEKSLHSEDEIFVALAQLKKVRDVLKGSLRLEDELESSANGKGR